MNRVSGRTTAATGIKTGVFSIWRSGGISNVLKSILVDSPDRRDPGNPGIPSCTSLTIGVMIDAPDQGNRKLGKTLDPYPQIEGRD